MTNEHDIRKRGTKRPFFTRIIWETTGLFRQIAGEAPQKSSLDLFRVPWLTHPRKRGFKGCRRAPNETGAAIAAVTRDTRKKYFGLPKKSLDPRPDFDIMPRNPDTIRGGNRSDPDSAEEFEPSCSAEGLVTPLLGTQSE